MRLNERSLCYRIFGVIRFFIVKIYHWRKLVCSGLSLFGPNLCFLIENGGQASIGTKTILANNVFIQSNGHFNVGNNLFVNAYSRIVCHDSIDIGNSVTIASGVTILDHDHKFTSDGTSRKADGYTTAPVRIGSNVWIGDRVVVLKGVTIGDNVTIGAGSIVTKDIPANTVAVGVPARVKSIQL